MDVIMKCCVLNNATLSESRISRNNNEPANQCGIIPKEFIRPNEEHIFNVSLHNKQFRVIVVNETCFTIRADMLIDEECPVLLLRREGGDRVPFIGLESGDQTIVIDDAFLRKYHS